MKKALLILMVMMVLTACGEIPSIEEESNIDSEAQGEEEVKTPDFNTETDAYILQVRQNSEGLIEYSYTSKEQTFAQGTNQPFDNIFDATPITGTYDPKRPLRYNAVIEYNKRDDGAFIYCNNPEMLAPEDVGQALLRNRDMQGDYIFTFEHSNYSDIPFYLGYQLLNTGDEDAQVTVYNIGLQVEGEWLGQRSWSDYFNYNFTLPEDYFLQDGKVNPIYFGCDYVYYEPRIYKPQTFVIPPGEYIYVLGGTTKDAYDNINVGNTADLIVQKGKCVNGVVKFDIQKGSMQGSFYCYTDAEQVKANPQEQGYIITRNDKNYGAQYKGTDPKQGLIESTITFFVDDNTDRGRLPVKYDKESDAKASEKTTPYQEYSMTSSTVFDYQWFTSLNSNNSANAIGTDMMVFEYIDEDGNPIIIDNNRADGRGRPANTGNWMVQYTDNINLVNLGDNPREFKIYKKGAVSGALFVMVRNDKGEVLDAIMQAHPYHFDSPDSAFYGIDKSLLVEKNGHYWFKVADGRPYIDVVNERSLVYTVTVPGRSAERVSVDYLILGNSNGGATHWVEVDKG